MGCLGVLIGVNMDVDGLSCGLGLAVGGVTVCSNVVLTAGVGNIGRLVGCGTTGLSYRSLMSVFWNLVGSVLA